MKERSNGKHTIKRYLQVKSLFEGIEFILHLPLAFLYYLTNKWKINVVNLQTNNSFINTWQNIGSRSMFS